MIVVTPDLLARHDRAVPRYTSYPTALEFGEGYTELIGLDPAVAGITVRLIDAGTRIELNAGTHRVIVLGYDGKPYLRVDHEGVAFEVDDFDAMEHAGWSVVITGVAHEVVDPAELDGDMRPSPGGHPNGMVTSWRSPPSWSPAAGSGPCRCSPPGGRRYEASSALRCSKGGSSSVSARPTAPRARSMARSGGR